MTQFTIGGYAVLTGENWGIEDAVHRGQTLRSPEKGTLVKITGLNHGARLPHGTGQPTILGAYFHDDGDPVDREWWIAARESSEWSARPVDVEGILDHLLHWAEKRALNGFNHNMRREADTRIAEARAALTDLISNR